MTLDDLYDEELRLESERRRLIADINARFETPFAKVRADIEQAEAEMAERRASRQQE